MVIDIHAPDYDGKMRRVYDANGKELEYITACNTETGEATHLCRDDNGFVFDETRCETVKEVRLHTAPLTVVIQ